MIRDLRLKILPNGLDPRLFQVVTLHIRGDHMLQHKTTEFGNCDPKSFINSIALYIRIN